MNGTCTAAPTTMPRRREARALHLVDVENLLGTRRDVASCTTLVREYLTGRHHLPGDQVVVATGPALAAACWFSWPPSARRLLGHGVDGADRALLRDADLPHLAQRYQRLVVASGDHAFADLAGSARSAGIHVSVVVGEGALSSRLRAAACDVHRLPAARGAEPQLRLAA